MQMFKYFLECYFNVSEDYKDLDKIIQDFIFSEKKCYQDDLSKELSNVLLEKKYNESQQYIKKYGMRTMSIEKTEVFIRYLCNKLVNFPSSDVTVDTFYNIK